LKFYPLVDPIILAIYQSTHKKQYLRDTMATSSIPPFDASDLSLYTRALEEEKRWIEQRKGFTGVSSQPVSVRVAEILVFFHPLTGEPMGPNAAALFTGCAPSEMRGKIVQVVDGRIRYPGNFVFVRMWLTFSGFQTFGGNTEGLSDKVREELKFSCQPRDSNTFQYFQAK
jgi:hypothetical protein